MQRDSSEFEFKKLIKTSMNGYFPLFDNALKSGINLKNDLSIQEHQTCKNILLKLSKHKSWKKKETIISSLSIDDKSIFIKAFLNKVEEKLKEMGHPLQ